MKKLLLLAVLLISLISCSTEESRTEEPTCPKVTSVLFFSEEGYIIFLNTGQEIHTGYVKPEYIIGDDYCII